MSPPEMAPASQPWTTPELRRVVDLQVERDGAALRALLRDEDADVRARAALALASVEEPEATEELVALLADPVTGVRLEAAFALGQLPLPDDGALLARALDEEDDAQVRAQLIRALGLQGEEPAAEILLALEARNDAEEARRMLALASLGSREVAPPGLSPTLLEGLEHAAPEVRQAAAYFFGQRGTFEYWGEDADRVRRALDGYGTDDPAAMYLLLGLGALRERDDLNRIVDWVHQGADWRIRVNAVFALSSQLFLEAPGTRDLLFEVIETDPSPHVRVAAAQAVSVGLVVPRPVQDRMADWLGAQDPRHWWAQVPVARRLNLLGRQESVVAWGRRVQGQNPMAAIRALEMLSSAEGFETTAFMWEMTDHDDPRVRAVALSVLGERWATVFMEPDEVEEIFDLLVERVASGTPPEVQRAVHALTGPTYTTFDAEGRILEAVRQAARPEASVPTLVALLEAVESIGILAATDLTERYLEHPEPRVRVAAAKAHRWIADEERGEAELPDPERTVDWEALEALGPEPRLHLDTERGEVVIRLLPEHAPLTVQTVARLVEEGRYDRSLFHRVVPNFVAQGGDFMRGDGSGTPGFTIRSEFTRVPVGRGVIAMASAGKDTEDSQFFLTHSMQPHLDGTHTVFGWVETGEAALDGILEGDRIVRARVVSGSEG